MRRLPRKNPSGATARDTHSTARPSGLVDPARSSPALLSSSSSQPPLRSSLPLASLPLASLPLASLPLASLPLASLPLASLPLASLAQVWATQGVLEPLSPRGSEPEADGGVAALSWLCVLHGGGTRLCAGLGRMLARRLWQPGLEQRAVRALEQRPRAAEHPLTGGIRPAATPTERGGTWVRERRGRLIEPLGDRAHTARHAAADGAERPAPVRRGGVRL